jgi:radical SAM superfamily enzyme YgiQ (UPF0313 family)
LSPDIKILVGGSKVDYGYVPNFPFDHLIKGQGEDCLRYVVASYVEGKTPEKYVSDKEYAYAGYNVESTLIFQESDAVSPGETLPIEFGRGCVFKCSYCTYNLTGKGFGDFTKSADVLYRTLMTNYERFGTTRYVIVDDTINDSLEKALVLQSVSRRLPFRFEFGGYMRLELFQKHPEMKDIYQECGLRAPVFGVETFNKQAGSTVGKGYGERAKDTLQELWEFWGVEVPITINLIIGLPFDSRYHIEKQQAWLEESKLGAVSYNPLSLKTLGDSPMSTGALESFYKDYEPSDHEVSFLGNRLQTARAWKSDWFTFYEAVKYSEELRERYLKTRPDLLHRVNGFIVLNSLGHVSLDALKTDTPVDVFLSRLGDTILSKYANAIEQVSIEERPFPTEAVYPQRSSYSPRIPITTVLNRGLR